jgi:hypothetical protein
MRYSQIIPGWITADAKKEQVGAKLDSQKRHTDINYK